MANVKTGPGMEGLNAGALRALHRAIAELRRDGGGQAQVAAGRGLSVYAFSTGQNLVWEFAENDGAPRASGTVPLVKPEGESDDSDDVTGDDEPEDRDEADDNEAAERPSLDEPEEEPAAPVVEIVTADERAVYADYGLESLLNLTEEQRAELFAELERAIAAHSATHLLRFGSETIATAELCRLAQGQNFAQFMDEGWADRLLFLNRCREN